MTTKKTVFIIPGYKHRPSQKAYKQLSKMLKKEGYHPIPITIPWKQTTISENTEYFLKRFKKIRRKEKYILGFSYGAMIAFLASTKVSTAGLILCSLSPYFKEDVTKVSAYAASSITTPQYEDFSKLHCARLARKVKAKQILFLHGEKETKPLIKRVHEAFGHISSKHKYLVSIKKADHDIGNKNYLRTIHHVTQGLNWNFKFVA